MNIGYIGLGDMGGALAERLASQHPLKVYDLSPAAVARLVAAGAAAATDAAELASTCDVVILCLPTSAHVRSLVSGDGGLAESLSGGALIIDQTSGDPLVTRALSAELAPRGIRFVDAPVSGGAPAALAGTISIMLGASEGNVSQATEVLRLISPTITHIGPVGTGHTMKLINNLVSCTQRILTLEALAIATKNGVGTGTAVEVLSRGGARNAYLEQQGHAVLQGDRDRGFSLALAHKDLRLACELASAADVPTFFGSLSRDIYRTAITALGPSAHVENIATYVETLTGVALTE